METLRRLSQRFNLHSPDCVEQEPGKSRDLEGELMAMSTERRHHARAEVRWPVTIRTAQEVIEAKLRNLGAGGAYIHCDHTPEPGESVELTLRPPDSPPIEITAEVMWAGKVLALGMGVRFIEISDKDLQFISRIVSEELGDNNNL